MPLNIKITNFEGPFDLLLHLIKKNEMDIYNIKIYEITNQYLEYLNGMKELDLEITSEFIVVAATLLEIKSQMLLPKKDEKKEEEEDPRKDLVQKLIEYKKFKAASKFLRVRFIESGQVFSKKPETIEDKPSNASNDDILKNISMLDLYNLYNDLINRYRSKINQNNTLEVKISADKYRIEDKMLELKEIIRVGGKYSFREVVRKCESKIEVVVIFLALLELIRMRNIAIFQEDSFKEIYIERISSNDTR